MRISPVLCGLWLGVGLSVAGCKPGGSQETDPGTSEASETESCTPGSENCICGEDASCEPGLLCASNTCIPHDALTTSGASVPGTSTVDETSDTGTPTETGGHSTGGTETGTSECDPGAGLMNPACEDPSAPYCGADGVCVGCDEVACGDVSADTPACDAASGRCVECTADDAEGCSGTTPICDAAASACVGCREHSQCTSGACQLATGACFESVLYVDLGADCDKSDGTKELPFCEIDEAAAKVSKLEPTVIHVLTSPKSYLKQVQIASGVTVAIVREGSGAAKLEVAGALDSLVVNDDATLYVSGLQISKGEVAKGLTCTDGARVWLDSAQMVERKGLGLDGVNCELTLRQSRVYLNLGGGIRVNGGKLRLEDSFVVSNGGSFSPISGIVVSNGAAVDIVYSTIADNDGKAGVAESIDCTGMNAVALRNSVLFGQTAATSVDCALATAATSVIDSAMLKGEGNTTLAELDSMWFVQPETGDFTINADAPFKDVAVWKTGDPTQDYNGDVRPNTDGAKDYAGADRPN